MTVIDRRARYSDYLQLEKILASQDPLSREDGAEAHDEMLFIIVHQIYELWFRQVMHELDSILLKFGSETVNESDMRICTSRLRRMVRILDHGVQQFRILETMSPLDFLDFRGSLGSMSGFQSYQFRLLENKLGLRRSDRLEEMSCPYDSGFPDAIQEQIDRSERDPSLFDLLQGWLERTPFLLREDFCFLSLYRQALQKMLDRDRKEIESATSFSNEEKAGRIKRLEQVAVHYEELLDEERYNRMIHSGNRRLSHQAMLAALFIHLYRDYPMLQMPYQLLNAVHNFDRQLTLWRYRHCLMIQRMIGSKMGTGGSSGHDYLRETVEQHQVFSDFNHLSTLLLPRSVLQPLPESLQRDLNFFYVDANQ